MLHCRLSWYRRSSLYHMLGCQSSLYHMLGRQSLLVVLVKTCKHQVKAYSYLINADGNYSTLMLASFLGLPCFCSSICIQYNTRKRKSADRRTKKNRGRPGNEVTLMHRMSHLSLGVVLHIGVSGIPQHQCVRPPPGRDITCYLGNITVEERCEQHSYMLAVRL